MKNTVNLKLVITLFITLFLSPAFAITLGDALAQAEQRSGVVNAVLDLSDAQLNQTRTQSDPLALKIDLVQARQRVEAAQTALQQARFDAYSEIASAYTQALQAQAQVQLASMARDLSQQSLNITQIRFERGSATQLDVQDSQTSLEDAANNLATAREGFALAQNSLQSLIGLDVSVLEPISPNRYIPLPPLETFLANLDNTATLIQVSQGLELSQLSLELLDPSYASRSQIDNARLQVETTETSLREARRGVDLQVRSVYNNALTAQEAVAIQQASLRNAVDRETVEKQRLDAGLIAEINYNQSRLSTTQARLGTLQAEHNYLNALYNLQAGSATSIEALNPSMAMTPEATASQ